MSAKRGQFSQKVPYRSLFRAGGEGRKTRVPPPTGGAMVSTVSAEPGEGMACRGHHRRASSRTLRGPRGCAEAIEDIREGL